MFLGSFKTYFTGKNRVVLPKRFRKELEGEDKFYITLGQDGEIWGFNNVQWLKEVEQRLRLPISDPRGRVQRRRFFSRAEECILDTQGRFILPQEFVEYAEIKTEVIFVGAGDHFEIWEPQQWSRQTEKQQME